MTKEKRKLNKKHLIGAIAVLLLAIVLGWFGYPFVRLLPLGYPVETIISIGQKNLVSQFASEEYSPLFYFEQEFDGMVNLRKEKKKLVMQDFVS